MKDMYSFHTTQESLTKFYGQVLEAYVKAYERCGLNVKVVQASGGIFTKNMSHEFQALTDAGEDMLIACTNCDFGQNSEIATYKAGDTCPKCEGTLAQMKGVEVGNIFDLGTKYSDAFDFNFTDEDGTQKRVLMGCYGIGTTRLVGSIVEVHNDERGIIWPKSVAPMPVHLVTLKSKDAEIQDRIIEEAEDLYDALLKEGIDVLWDDREASPGEKLADADLLGMPLRLLISEKTLVEESAEWKLRSSKDAKLVKLADVFEEVQSFVNEK